jgi:hypothetical protein
VPDINNFGFCKDHFPQSVITSASGYWPWGVFIWLMAKVETLSGWIFGLLFVAIVAGIIKKD